MPNVGIDQDKLERCISDIKAKGGVNAYAVCMASYKKTHTKVGGKWVRKEHVVQNADGALVREAASAGILFTLSERQRASLVRYQETGHYGAFTNLRQQELEVVQAFYVWCREQGCYWEMEELFDKALIAHDWDDPDDYYALGYTWSDNVVQFDDPILCKKVYQPVQDEADAHEADIHEADVHGVITSSLVEAYRAMPSAERLSAIASCQEQLDALTQRLSILRQANLSS